MERSGTWVAWRLWGASLLLLVVEPADPYYRWPLLVVNGPVFATVGAIIVARRSAHPIGWLLAGIGLSSRAGQVLLQTPLAISHPSQGYRSVDGPLPDRPPWQLASDRSCRA
jgi:hypothetical protein